MKLSMWIIQHWLSSYSPVATIVEGKQSIEGSRLYAKNQPYDKRYIYVAKTKDFFFDSSSEEILLVHRNDVLSLGSFEIEEIYNRVVEAFEYYNRWENQLLLCAQGDHPEQRIIDTCKDIFGPMFVMDLKYNLFGYSKTYTLGEVNFVWDIYIEQSNPTLDIIYKFKESEFSKLLFKKHNRLIFEEPYAAPFSYGIMISYCDNDDNLIGQLVIAEEHPIPEYELQLSTAVENALNSIKNKTMRNTVNRKPQSMLLESMIAGAMLKEDIEKLLILQDWTHRDTFLCICLLPLEEAQKALIKSLIDQLYTLIQDSVIIVVDQQILCLTRTEKHMNHIKHVLDFIRERTYLQCGIGYPFSDLADLPYYYRQATEALQYGVEHQLKITYYKDCGVYALLRTSDFVYRRYCLHPVVKFLHEYDAQNRTDLANTLMVFIQNERSYSRTGKVLYVHRNTILQRLEKMKSLYPFDLSDANEREYILLSYRLYDLEHDA